MKVTFTAFDGKQFDTMDECMEYEDSFKMPEDIEVMAGIEGVGILTFGRYGEDSLQWEDACDEIPNILYFKNEEVLGRYTKKAQAVIRDIADYSFCNFWVYAIDEEQYEPYDEYIAQLKEAKRQLKYFEEQYIKMRQM